jgi:glycosyltransferase involved in cell wall biosynthesis
MGGGPYDVIRDGVDGLLARNKAQWREQLTRLATSPALREEMAGRARERVLAEYDVHRRVEEWADAFRWAADHAGRGAARAGSAGYSAT